MSRKYQVIPYELTGQVWALSWMCQGANVDEGKRCGESYSVLRCCSYQLMWVRDVGVVIQCCSVAECGEKMRVVATGQVKVQDVGNEPLANVL